VMWAARFGGKLLQDEGCRRPADGELQKALTDCYTPQLSHLVEYYLPQYI
jgi:hypothetical protein